MPEIHEIEAMQADLEKDGLEDVNEHDDYGRALYEQAQAEMTATRNLSAEFDRVDQEGGPSRFIRIEEAHIPNEASRSRNPGTHASEEILRSLDQQIKLTESQLDSLN